MVGDEKTSSMSEGSVISTKKKIIIGVVVLICTAVLVVSVFMFSPDPMTIDWSTVQKVPNNVTLLSADDERNSTGATALVKLNEDGTVDESPWKVLQFTDMHLMQFHDQNAVTMGYFIETIKRERPDFVVLTGDIITRPRGRARAIQLADVFEKMGIYWCYCLGNHEGDSPPFTLTREENIRIWSKYEHCLVENDVKKTSDGTAVWGLGNTVVNLLGNGYKVVQSMIFMDSGSKLGYAKDKETKTLVKELGLSDDSYDFLRDSQLKWYEEQVRKVTNNLTNGVKTMLFIHIPLVEMDNVKLFEATGDPKKSELPDGWYYAYPDKPLMVGGEVYGYMAVKNGWKLIGDTGSYEKCYCSSYNSGAYDLMKSLRKGVNALFCGHDHVSNSILYEESLVGDDPVYLCYGVCSGLESYNLFSLGLSDVDDYSLRGYSRIMINADSTFDLYHYRYNNVEHPTLRVLHGVACD